MFIGFFVSACTNTAQVEPKSAPEIASTVKNKSLIEHKQAMIAVANPRAAQAALKILQSGGSAIDAAITAQMVLNLVEPQSSGIGGGGFLLVFDPKSKRLVTYDGRETAPRDISQDVFLKNDGEPMKFFEAVVGGRAVGVPGLVKMLEIAHAEFGALKWNSLFDEPIRLSKEGFEVSPRLNLLVARDGYLKDDPTARAYFYNGEGEAHRVGHILKNPAFAKSLEQIRSGGAASLYFGQLADDIVHKVQNHPTNPGVLSIKDMMSYQVLRRDAICQPFQAYNICSMAPPSSGGLAIAQMLGLFDAVDHTQFERAHLMAELGKLAFSDRNAFVADPSFVDQPIEAMLEPSYLQKRANMISLDRALPVPVAPGLPLEFSAHDTDHGVSTTHLSIVDENGLVVSMTTSIENAFGSRQMVGGFLLNNQLTDFSFRPEKDGKPVANRSEPLKRPRSSMAPTIVLNEDKSKAVLAIGSPGGSNIIGYVANTLVNVLVDDRDLAQSFAQGHVTNRNGTTAIEQDTTAENFKEMLENKGHKVSVRAMTSGLHGIWINEDGSLEGAADPRREGVVLGY